MADDLMITGKGIRQCFTDIGPKNTSMPVSSSPEKTHMKERGIIFLKQPVQDI
jgi:hypothetical protein